jgi:hypothetical protein
MYDAEQALAAAEHYGNIRRECQQKAARIYFNRVVEALLAVASWRSCSGLPTTGAGRVST